MDIKCYKCGRFYRDIFDTIVRCDYVEPGKGVLSRVGVSHEWCNISSVS